MRRLHRLGIPKAIGPGSFQASHATDTTHPAIARFFPRSPPIATARSREKSPEKMTAPIAPAASAAYGALLLGGGAFACLLSDAIA
ncbi:hypothetical protein E2562_009869 [Oryza meyeriana var. granulata]|uniref:Uncharacterized protein n=1 Tax=Oryza meyeriana var. granulata TaxID=110450 RepID=A0A6G1BUM1_9ORYZ|nr:hypothetical protein E2562_009869 [Oryza meyeriana var. granulata]